MRYCHLPKPTHTPPAAKQPHRCQQRPKTSQTRTTQSQGRLIVSNIRLDQPDLPLLFLWLTTEGIEAGRACKNVDETGCRLETSDWSPGQAGGHHQHGVTKGALGGANPNGLDQEPWPEHHSPSNTAEKTLTGLISSKKDQNLLPHWPERLARATGPKDRGQRASLKQPVPPSHRSKETGRLRGTHKTSRVQGKSTHTRPNQPWAISGHQRAAKWDPEGGLTTQIWCHRAQMWLD